MNGRGWARATLVMGVCALVAWLILVMCAIVTPTEGAPAPRFRVCSANVQNTPDMSDRAVREDVRAARRHCDLILWQEIREPADYRAVTEVLSSRWQSTEHRDRGGVPISWRKGVFDTKSVSELIRVSDGTPRCPNGRSSFNPPRHVTTVTLSWRATGQSVSVVNLHYPQRRGCRQTDRAKKWRQAYATTQQHLPAGPLIIGGDWNRREDEIRPMTRWHWITASPRALDHLAVARTGWTVAEKFTHRLNSDHSLTGSVLQLRTKRHD